jgi:hypothetical protein
MKNRGSDCHAHPSRNREGAGCNVTMAQHVASVSCPLAYAARLCSALPRNWRAQFADHPGQEPVRDTQLRSLVVVCLASYYDFRKRFETGPLFNGMGRLP